MASFKYLPLFVYGKVVKGFGRGSKELGIPTANLNEETIDLLPQELKPGIYYGLASVDHGPVNKMVLSVGWNPFYHNEKKSMETHILHEFKEDFYGSLLKVILIDYIRPEKNFSSLDELIEAIRRDINVAENKIDSSYKHYFTHPFWDKKFTGKRGVYKKEFPISADFDDDSSQPRKDTEAMMNGESK